MSAVHWNLDCEDWRYGDQNPGKVFENVVQKLSKENRNMKGPIILQHDTRNQIVLYQGSIINHLKRNGYNIVTMDQCISDY